jgi:hypothetical protein
MAEETGAAPVGEFRRTEDFASVYANNVQFELSAWDLKVIFGVLDQRGSKIAVEQHTSVTVSWLQAKLLNYFLEINLAIHEVEHGKIKVPELALPPVFPPPPAHLADNPVAKTMCELANKIRDEFIASL